MLKLQGRSQGGLGNRGTWKKIWLLPCSSDARVAAATRSKKNTSSKLKPIPAKFPKSTYSISSESAPLPFCLQSSWETWRTSHSNHHWLVHLQVDFFPRQKPEAGQEIAFLNSAPLVQLQSVFSERIFLHSVSADCKRISALFQDRAQSAQSYSHSAQFQVQGARNLFSCLLLVSSWLLFVAILFVCSQSCLVFPLKKTRQIHEDYFKIWTLF